MSFKVFFRERDIRRVLEKLNADPVSLRTLGSPIIPDDVIVLFEDISPFSTTVSDVAGGIDTHACIYLSKSSEDEMRKINKIQLVLPTKRAMYYEIKSGKDIYTMLEEQYERSEGIQEAILERVLDRFVVLSLEDFPITRTRLFEIIDYHKMLHSLYGEE